MTARTAIALSGGIDSLVSAYLLKQSGHDLVGLHFLNGFEPYYRPRAAAPGGQPPYLIENPATAGYGKLLAGLRKMATGLDMPVLIYDCAAAFRDRVIDYFQAAYRSGLTPNPCMVCNRRIKFGLLLAAARALGARCLATGHYVRTFKTADGLVHLQKGVDTRKDQSYFLARLTQDQLAGTHFPLGALEKRDVIDLAGRRGWRPLAQRESQDVCFIGEQTYGAFLANHLDFKPSPGEIEDLQGNHIGHHDGLHLFTIGQRRGINCPSSDPYYVCRLDTARNVLIVGRKPNLLSEGCIVNDINWIIPPTGPRMRLQVRVRYRSPTVEATVTRTGDTSAEVRFDVPQSAITPGQGAVFYKDDEVLGGGWIAIGET